MGAGRTKPFMHLIGLWAFRSLGEVIALGQPLERPTARKAIEQEVALASGDRKRCGLFHGQSVGFNLSLSSLGRYARLGFLDEDAEIQASQTRFSVLRIKAAGLCVHVSSIFGGNQQKVGLGCAPMSGPRVIMLDEPTHGIDAGSELEVYEVISQLTERDCGVRLVSSELPELLGTSDRIVMLHQGQGRSAFLKGNAKLESLSEAALSGDPQYRPGAPNLP